jgi:hypothetical protein
MYPFVMILLMMHPVGERFDSHFPKTILHFRDMTECQIAADNLQHTYEVLDAVCFDLNKVGTGQLDLRRRD